MPDEPGEIQPESDFTTTGSQVAVGSGGPEESAGVEIPEVLPVLPLKNTVLFPFLLSPLLVASARSKRLIDQVLLSPERLLVAAAVKAPVEGSPGRVRRVQHGNGDAHRQDAHLPRSVVPVGGAGPAPRSHRRVRVRRSRI